MDNIPLSKTTKFVVDNRGRTAPTASSGIPLIATNCISNRDLYPIYENLRYVSKETYETWFRSHPQPNDIILTLKGSQNGAVCLVPDPVNFVIAQDMVALRVDEKVIYPRFLFAALRSVDVQHQIKNLDVSGVIPHLKKSDFDRLLIPFPDRDLQETIGDIYFYLSSKIDLLRRQNKTLESLTETLFRQRFIEEAADSWHIGRLGDVISIYDSKRIPLSAMERDKMKVGDLFPYYGAASVMDFVNDYIFDGEYLLMGEDGTVQTDDGKPILQMPTGKFWVNNHAHVLQATEPFTNYFIYIFLKNTDISHAVTGAVQPKINQENLKAIKFTMPRADKVADFVSFSNDTWNKIKSNNQQIRSLTIVRDVLSPKLISGEVDLTVPIKEREQ